MSLLSLDNQPHSCSTDLSDLHWKQPGGFSEQFLVLGLILLSFSALQLTMIQKSEHREKPY